MLEGPRYVWPFVFFSQRVNPSTRANRAFPVPISSNYRGSDIECHMAQFILCWCNNSQSLESRLAKNFAVVYVLQRDDAFVPR